MGSKEATLRSALDAAAPLYLLPRDDVVGEALIPAFSAATSVDCMMGFFSSSALAQLAPGLAEYLASAEHTLRLVVSPYLSEADQRAIQQAVSSELEDLGSELVVRSLPSVEDLAKHTLDCLVWLLREERLAIKIALMPKALFHPKVWLFRDDNDSAVIHGSSNMTGRGLGGNREQLTVSRAWRGEESAFHVESFGGEFKSLWTGTDDSCLVVDLSSAVKKRLLRDYGKGPQPTTKDFQKLWRRAYGFSDSEASETTVARSSLVVPSYIEFRGGEYAHQGAAVDAWFGNGGRGILEMATGSGKTITAMICASLLQDREEKLLVVVSAPYRPLIRQWCGEIEPFGVRAVDLTEIAGSTRRDGAIKDAIRRLRLGTSDAEVLVTSNATLCTAEFRASLEGSGLPTLFVADECHNLGAAEFIANPPDFFRYRLGLSATPVRQYDADGTSKLLEYFGDVCFQFTLDDAIGKCLTPYEYYAHVVHLTGSEMTRWRELSEEIAGSAWKIAEGRSDPHLDHLLRQRRLVLETAEEKISKLREVLGREDLRRLRFALIYATDKDPEQLLQVNELLNSLRVLFHQITSEETASNRLAGSILSRFQSGDLQALTAKRVLDEGVNIPEIMRAYILASTTVERQWVQRRGRLLRTCRAIGKTHAIVHDFVALPPNPSALGGPLDEDARKIVKSELARLWEFARLSRNGPDEGGAYQLVEELQQALLR